MTAIFTESEYEIELSAVQGLAGPQGYATPIATGSVIGNSSGSTAAPVARTAQQMGVISAVDTQTFDSSGKALARTNIGVVAWEGVYFEATLTYTYYGGLANNDWKINRFTSDAVKTSATIANNPSVASLTAAWAARTRLTYS